MTTNEFWLTIGAGTLASVGANIARWCWARSVQTLQKKRTRDNLVRQMECEVFNLMHNVSNWIDERSDNPFPLVFPGTNRIVKRTQDDIVERVAKVQSSVMDELFLLRGLFSFSKKQRHLLWEISSRASILATAVTALNGPVSLHKVLWEFTTQPDEVVSMGHVHAAFEHLKSLVGAGGRRGLHGRLGQKYRFMPWRLKQESNRPKRPLAAQMFQNRQAS